MLVSNAAGAAGEAVAVPGAPCGTSLPSTPSNEALVPVVPLVLVPLVPVPLVVVALIDMPPNRLLPAELGVPANRLLLPALLPPPAPVPNRDPAPPGAALVLAAPGKSAATGGSGESSNRSFKAGDESTADLYPRKHTGGAMACTHTNT